MGWDGKGLEISIHGDGVVLASRMLIFGQDERKLAVSTMMALLMMSDEPTVLLFIFSFSTVVT